MSLNASVYVIMEDRQENASPYVHITIIDFLLPSWEKVRQK